MRHLADLTDDEWEDLMHDVADLVLARHRVIGSVAGDYSLYAALEEERNHALSRAGRGREATRRRTREQAATANRDPHA
jgi:hypothetical protein